MRPISRELCTPSRKWHSREMPSWPPRSLAPTGDSRWWAPGRERLLFRGKPAELLDLQIA